MSDGVLVRTVLQARGPAAAAVLTDEQLEAIGRGAKTPAVRVTVNGGHTFAGRIGRMGGETLLGFNKAVREAAGVQAGDEVELLVQLDTAERAVEVPQDLADALDAAGARSAFDALAYSHRKEHVRAVEEAKRPETRAKRVAAAVAKVTA